MIEVISYPLLLAFTFAPCSVFIPPLLQVCLKELGRLPGPRLENCVDRESNSLTAALALGTFTMGRGKALVTGKLAGLRLPEMLHNHMLGGPHSSR